MIKRKPPSRAALRKAEEQIKRTAMTEALRTAIRKRPMPAPAYIAAIRRGDV